jgi:hypothetical protein
MLSKANEKFQNLPQKYKVMYAGIAISSIALFMPWYSDVDAFNAGASYLGITGPTSVMGISLLILNIFTLGLITFKFRFKREAKLPFSRVTLEKIHGPVYLYTVFLMMSVYFNDQFGINLATKTAGFGVYVGSIGAIISTISGLKKQKEVQEVLPKIVEDVIYENSDATRDMWEQQQDIAKQLEERERQPIRPPSSDQAIPAYEGQYLRDKDQKSKVRPNHMIRTDL